MSRLTKTLAERVIEESLSPRDAELILELVNHGFLDPTHFVSTALQRAVRLFHAGSATAGQRSRRLSTSMPFCVWMSFQPRRPKWSPRSSLKVPSPRAT